MTKLLRQLATDTPPTCSLLFTLSSSLSSDPVFSVNVRKHAQAVIRKKLHHTVFSLGIRILQPRPQCIFSLALGTNL